MNNTSIINKLQEDHLNQLNSLKEKHIKVQQNHLTYKTNEHIELEDKLDALQKSFNSLQTENIRLYQVETLYKQQIRRLELIEMN